MLANIEGPDMAPAAWQAHSTAQERGSRRTLQRGIQSGEGGSYKGQGSTLQAAAEPSGGGRKTVLLGSLGSMPP